MNKIFSALVLASSLSLVACGGGGSSPSVPATPAPTAGCYGVNHTNDQYNGTSVYLGTYGCAYELQFNPAISKFEPLTTVGNPPASPAPPTVNP